MTQQDSLSALVRLIEEHCDSDGIFETAIPGLHYLKLSSPSAPLPSLHQPSVCLIVQGAKQALLEDEIYPYKAAEYLAISVDLPLLGQVTEASLEQPYLCLKLDLDARLLSELITEINGERIAENRPFRGLFVGKADAALLDGALRLISLLQTPKDLPHLGPLVRREIHYRLLTGEHGRRIAQIGVSGSSLQRIAQALQKLRNNFTSSVRIEELAEIASMSPSSFHQHFRQVTAMSPLQYQKRLRLLEARRLMLAEEADASSAAYRVGYESASQFSREYSRMFGAPPMRDVELLKTAAVAL